MSGYLIPDDDDGDEASMFEMTDSFRASVASSQPTPECSPRRVDPATETPETPEPARVAADGDVDWHEMMLRLEREDDGDQSRIPLQPQPQTHPPQAQLIQAPAPARVQKHFRAMTAEARRPEAPRSRNAQAALAVRIETGSAEERHAAMMAAVNGAAARLDSLKKLMIHEINKETRLIQALYKQLAHANAVYPTEKKSDCNPTR